MNDSSLFLHFYDIKVINVEGFVLLSCAMFPQSKIMQSLLIRRNDFHDHFIGKTRLHWCKISSFSKKFSFLCDLVWLFFSLYSSCFAVCIIVVAAWIICGIIANNEQDLSWYTIVTCFVSITLGYILLFFLIPFRVYNLWRRHDPFSDSASVVSGEFNPPRSNGKLFSAYFFLCLHVLLFCSFVQRFYSGNGLRVY